MTSRSRRDMIIMALIGLVVVALIVAIVRRSRSEHMDMNTSDSRAVHEEDVAIDTGDDIQFIEGADDPSFEIGIGMGPGVYGSGRHTSEMIGN